MILSSACPLNAAMEANSPADAFSMPGDVSDLFLPGRHRHHLDCVEGSLIIAGGGSLGQGHLPTSRPQKMHKKKEKSKQSASKPEKPSAAPGSMPNFDDFLGDDLQLTDESDDN